MVETQSDTNTALAHLAKASLEGLQQLQQDFAVAKQAFQDQLMRDLESSTARMHSYFEKMMSGLDSAFQATLSKVKSTMTTIQSDMGSLSKSVNAARATSEDIDENVGKIFQKVVEGSVELAKVQSAQWDASYGVAAELQISLKNMQEGDVSVLIRTLSDMGLQLESSNQIIAQIYNRQISIEERMGYLGESFTQLETKAQSFSAAQTRQAETQSKIHDQMEVNMQIAQGYLSDVASTAMQLQATVAETHSKIESITAFTRIFGNIFDWAALSCLVVVIFFAIATLTIVWRSSRKLAIALAVAACRLLITGQ
ncbi:MAG: hypothetical protein Q9164_002067 [Protoblastenia rupestris]